MSVQEIGTIISQLPPSDLAELTQWFEQFQADAWDRQIAQDVKAGRFDAILQRVDTQAEAGQCKPQCRSFLSLQSGAVEQSR